MAARLTVELYLRILLLILRTLALILRNLLLILRICAQQPFNTVLQLFQRHPAYENFFFILTCDTLDLTLRWSILTYRQKPLAQLR